MVTRNQCAGGKRGDCELAESFRIASCRCAKVSDVRPLAQLTSLQTLDLGGTQVSDEAGEEFRTALRQAGLSEVDIRR
jgi:hypothetical protein